MDGIPLFKDAPFTTTGRNRDLGPIAYEWQLSGSTTAEFGNNWLLVADLNVIAVPPAEEEFTMDTVGLGGSGEPTLSFTGDPGWDYQVEYSDDGAIWRTNLPGSFFTGLGSTTQLVFTDPTPEIPPGRWDRVTRSVTP